MDNLFMLFPTIDFKLPIAIHNCMTDWFKLHTLSHILVMVLHIHDATNVSDDMKFTHQLDE